MGDASRGGYTGTLWETSSDLVLFHLLVSLMHQVYIKIFCMRHQLLPEFSFHQLPENSHNINYSYFTLQLELSSYPGIEQSVSLCVSHVEVWSKRDALWTKTKLVTWENVKCLLLLILKVVLNMRFENKLKNPTCVAWKIFSWDLILWQCLHGAVSPPSYFNIFWLIATPQFPLCIEKWDRASNKELWCNIILCVCVKDGVVVGCSSDGEALTRILVVYAELMEMLLTNVSRVSGLITSGSGTVL